MKRLEMVKAKRSWLDRAGAAVGVGCALHCLALPLLLGVLPLAGAALLSHPMAELMLLGTALVLGTFAALDGITDRRGSWAAWVLAVGVGLLALRLVLGEGRMPGEPWVTPAISLVLAVGHLARAWQARLSAGRYDP